MQMRSASILLFGLNRRRAVKEDKGHNGDVRASRGLAGERTLAPAHCCGRERRRSGAGLPPPYIRLL